MTDTRTEHAYRDASERYAELGVPISLVIDRTDKSVYDIRPGEPQRVLRGDDAINLEPVLPDFNVTVSALFASVVNSWLRRRAQHKNPD